MKNNEKTELEGLIFKIYQENKDFTSDMLKYMMDRTESILLDTESMTEEEKTSFILEKMEKNKKEAIKQREIINNFKKEKENNLIKKEEKTTLEKSDKSEKAKKNKTREVSGGYIEEIPFGDTVVEIFRRRL